MKAALNWAFDHRLVDDNSAWRLVKPYRSTTSARVRFLTAAEQQALVNSAEAELRDLVAAALMTGARFGELARLSVRDFDPINGSVFIAESKSGKARHIPLTAGCIALFERLSANREKTAPLLAHARGRWKAAAYQREFKAAVARAELSHITLHELRHSYASTMVRAGAPLMVVAEALGHSGTRMAEMHYAHLAPSYVADTIRRVSKTSPQAIMRADRIARILDWRTAGHTLSDIAKAEKISVKRVSDLIGEAIEKKVDLSATEFLKITNLRLERLLRAHMASAEAGNPRAAECVIAVIDRQLKLIGKDASLKSNDKIDETQADKSLQRKLDAIGEKIQRLKTVQAPSTGEPSGSPMNNGEKD
ncbi:tyrosine-type recombinase/integrase [Methylocella silvestris]|uniref:tyrosine-type recombinase/integrase n=1 Tax=Methylocella silvestris TaxID=199596 RepID=UPI002477E1E0|nr:site-specific integrase [Methylocella silvestris]